MELNENEVYMSSFLFSFIMLFGRDWTDFWRNKMRFGATLLNTLTRFILIGFLFQDQVPTRESIALLPEILFLKSQSMGFLCITSTIMTSIYTVALSRIFDDI